MPKWPFDNWSKWPLFSLISKWAFCQENFRKVTGKNLGHAFFSSDGTDIGVLSSHLRKLGCVHIETRVELQGWSCKGCTLVLPLHCVMWFAGAGCGCSCALGWSHAWLQTGPWLIDASPPSTGKFSGPNDKVPGRLRILDVSMSAAGTRYLCRRSQSCVGRPLNFCSHRTWVRGGFTRCQKRRVAHYLARHKEMKAGRNNQTCFLQVGGLQCFCRLPLEFSEPWSWNPWPHCPEIWESRGIIPQKKSVLVFAVSHQWFSHQWLSRSCVRDSLLSLSVKPLGLELLSSSAARPKPIRPTCIFPTP